jgi:hypothetical protein
MRLSPKAHRMKLPIIPNIGGNAAATLAQCPSAWSPIRLPGRTTKRPTGCALMPDFLTRRHGTWHFVRRAPKRSGRDPRDS